MKTTIAISVSILSCVLLSSCPKPAPVIIHEYTIVKPKPTPKPKPKPRPRPETAESFRAVESAN